MFSKIISLSPSTSKINITFRMRIFSSKKYPGSSTCSGRASRHRTGGPYDRPTRLIPEYAHLVTSGEKKNSYHYLSKRGVPIFDARGVWLRNSGGDLIVSDPKNRFDYNQNFSYSSDSSDESEGELPPVPRSPYVPLMKTVKIQKIKKEDAKIVKVLPIQSLKVEIPANTDSAPVLEQSKPKIEKSNSNSNYKNIQITRGKLIFS